MIRKILIVVLTVAAVGVYSLRYVSYFAPSPILFHLQDSIHVYHLGRRAMNITIRRGAFPQAQGWDSRYEKEFMIPWWFRIIRFKHPAPYTRWDVTIYVRPTIAILAAYPTFAFIHGSVRRRLRLRRGLCIKCGYDLTGNVSGACPECGKAI